MSFTTDFGGFILLPLEKLAAYVNVVMENPLSLYGEYIMNQGNPKTQIRKDIIEYFFIQMALMRIAAYLGAAHGGRAVAGICKPLILMKKDICQTTYTRAKSFIVIVGVRNSYEILDYIQEDYFVYINKIYDICGQVADRYSGMVNSARNQKYLLMWQNFHSAKDGIITRKIENDKLEANALLAIITVVKSLSKCYRLVDLMEMSKKITNRMVSEFISKNSNAM
jgi:hypothetical protein